jgi:hypothetical protein
LRALFLLLLLANILFLAWARWIVPPAPTAGLATPSASAAGSIRLLREAPLARELSDAVQGSDLSDVEGDSVTCVSGGPFLDSAAAARAAGRLASLGFTSRTRASRDDVWVGQWVRVENLATPEDAENALVTLRAAGLTDATVTADGPDANVLSLGVFGEPGKAIEAAAAAQKAGFTTVTEDRYRTADVLWLDVDRQANAGLPGLDVFQGDGPPATRLELRPCPVAPAVVAAETETPVATPP